MTDSPVEPFGDAISQQVNTMSITSVMLAVAGFCGWFMLYIGLPFAIGAVVCGWIGIRRSERMDGTGRRTSIVGLTAGAVMTVANVIGVVLLLSGGSSG